jgi:hypothetical protein
MLCHQRATNRLGRLLLGHQTRKIVLEDLAVGVSGYRAPSFSVNLEMSGRSMHQRAGYRYSSSVYRFGTTIGTPDAPGSRTTSAPVWSVPLTTMRLFGRNWRRRQQLLWMPYAMSVGCCDE